MKVLMVSDFFKPIWEGGGPPRVAYEMSRRLVSRGHDVVVYTNNFMNTNYDLPNRKFVEGVDVRYFENFRRFFPQMRKIPSLPLAAPWVAIREISDFDIIHIHEHRTALAATIIPLAIKHKIPYVVQPHGSVLPFFQKQSRKVLFDKLIGETMLHNASRFIAISESESKQMIEIGVNPSLIEVIPNGIGIDETYVPDRGAFRKEIGLHDGPIILYLARFHRIKGPDLLVEAFSSVLERFPKSKLVMIGPDDGYLGEVQSLVREKGLADNVIFPGPIYDDQKKLNAYADADVYVLPSRYEIFGISILEALMAGTPVIVTDGCGIKDSIKNCGIVVPYKKDELANAIAFILSNPTMGRSMGENGKRTVRERYSWPSIIDRLESIYNGILNQNEKMPVDSSPPALRAK